MTKAKEKSPLQRLKERRRGVLSRDEWNKLTTVMIPPTEWTNAIVDIGERVTQNPKKVAEGYVLWSDVHDIYWDWCRDERNRRRELFLRWMGAISADAKPLRLGRYSNGAFIGKVLKRDERFGLAEHRDSHKWPALAWEMAEAIFAGLRLPDPHKQGATAKEAQAILDAVAHVHELAPKLSVPAACKRAGTNKTDFYRVGGKSWRQPRLEK